MKLLTEFEKEQETYRKSIWDRESKNVEINLPKSQFRMPRIYINDSDSGETTVAVLYGLPCCGLEFYLECPEKFSIAQLREFLKKTSEMREWVLNNMFLDCFVEQSR